jgi:hypothetical protein
MPPKKEWTFDIRDYVPNYGEKPPPGSDWKGDDAKAEEYYRHVNAMCFLLHDIPYSIVYGPAHAFATQMLKNLDAYTTKSVDEVLGAELTVKIREKLNDIKREPGAKNVKMADFYTTYQDDPNKPGHKVFKHFEAIADLDSAREKILCMPFIFIQKKHDNRVDGTQMLLHERLMTGFSLFDIYTQSKAANPHLFAAVVHGKFIGALTRKRGGVMLMLGGGGNNRRCGLNGCENNNDTWCNVSISGGCSTAS